MAIKTQHSLFIALLFLAELQVAQGFSYCYGGCWYGSWYIWTGLIFVVGVCCAGIGSYCWRRRLENETRNSHTASVVQYGSAAAPGQPGGQPAPFYYVDPASPTAAPGPPPYQLAAGMPQPDKSGGPPAYAEVISAQSGYVNPSGPAVGNPDAPAAPYSPQYPGYPAQGQGYPPSAQAYPGQQQPQGGSYPPAAALPAYPLPPYPTEGAPAPPTTGPTPAVSPTPTYPPDPATQAAPPYPVTSSS